MSLSEADTRAKLIDPALHGRGWTEELIHREVSAGPIVIGDHGPRKSRKGRLDYLLRVKVRADAQPIAVALIEAKAEHLPPMHGLEQAKLYGSCRRFHVPFLYTSNGHQFIEYDAASGRTDGPWQLADFPTPDDLRARYERARGIALDTDAARPLLQRYPRGEAQRRYYQDAAIRAVLEKLARGERRALLELATGSGKTFIAVQLMKKIADAAQLRRALFVCDRDELRTQGLGAFADVFGNDAAAVSTAQFPQNARIHVATYQTLGVDHVDADAGFLLKHYPEDYFSHIVIDECHRSAWGKWSEVLKRNPGAVQIGLTATPRQIEIRGGPDEASREKMIAADNLRHFGQPVYEYDIAQGIEDGYLAACEIVRRDIFLDGKRESEAITGLGRADLAGKTIADARTGEERGAQDAAEHYDAAAFEARLLLPERVEQMCRDLFQHLVQTGGPQQKTIVFCARDDHADRVAATLNNLYVDWCTRSGHPRAEPFAFKCTAAVQGADLLADFKAAERRFFVATTVDLLTTGVDVPAVRNIVFFRYVRSTIAFYQMLGRGTRLHPPSGKLMFRVYDYTDATRLFGGDFITRLSGQRERVGPGPGPEPPEPVLLVEGVEVRVSPAGRYIVTLVDGEARPVTVEEYKERLAARLLEEAPTLDLFRRRWIAPPERAELLAHLPEGERSAEVVRRLDDMDDYDLYDVLADLGYGAAPRTREHRADAFSYKHADWLRALPDGAAATLRAITAQFARAGTDALESRAVFTVPEVLRAGGLTALKQLGEPADVLRETKERLFAA